MSGSLSLVVVLHVNAGHEAEFERFEAAAASIMRRHGGAIERRIAIERGETAHPAEVHIVTFPDRAAFDRYRADPELAPLAALRTDAVRETIVWFGADRTPFV